MRLPGMRRWGVTIEANPLPEVKAMLDGVAPISATTCSPARSTAAATSRPRACWVECGLPNRSVK